MMFRNRLFTCMSLSALPILLGGCASIIAAPDGVDDYAVDAREVGKSTIVLSVASQKTCLTGYPAYLNVIDVKSDKEVDTFLMYQEIPSGAEIENETKSPDFLKAATLSPGSYALEFEILNKDTVNTPRAHFDLSANETVYLGEYFLGGDCGAFVRSNPIVISDKYERDSEIIKRFNANLHSRAISKRIPSFGADGNSVLDSTHDRIIE